MAGKLARCIVPLAAILSLFPLAARAADDQLTTLDQLVPDADLVPTKTSDGVQITGKGSSELKLLTPTEFKTPVTITAEVKTDKNNIRIYYGTKGVVIFDWDVNPKELRQTGPKFGKVQGVPNKGAIPPNQFATIEWVIDDKGYRISVDGVERCSVKGDYSNLSGKAGIGTSDNSTLTIKSFTVRGLKGDNKVGPVTASTPGDALALKVAVACAQPKQNAAEPALSNADAIERPDFINFPKSLNKSISTISIMTVLETSDGEATGTVDEVLAIVQPDSRRGNKAGVGFVRAQNDKMMRTSFEEAIRAVTLRYPLWQPGQIDISFRDKFTPTGGPSAGTAFAILTLSVLEGFDIDPHCAVTGDISADWHTEKVGGVSLKLRGAVADKRAIALIPKANVDVLADMALLRGLPSIYSLQVFSADTLQQAVAVARADRSADLAKAISQFTELQTLLQKNQSAVLHAPETLKSLQQIVALAPNHESAQFLLASIQNKAPKNLSLAATYYGCCEVLYPYRRLLTIDNKTIGVTVPAALQISARKTLDTLRPIANPRLAAVLRDLAAFTEVANDVSNHQSPVSALRQPLATLKSDWTSTLSDPDYLEQALREGY